MLLTAVNYAQQKLPLGLNNDTDKYKYNPLVILKMPHSTITSNNPDLLNSIKPATIKNIEVLRDNETIKLYGYKAKTGLIIVTYKIDSVINLSDSNTVKNILLTYKIGLKKQRLPLYIDSVYVSHPEDAYLHIDKITSVKIEKDQKTRKKFIDILTKQPKIDRDNYKSPSIIIR